MAKKPKLVALTGAGISAESGLGTFRGAGGLWEGHRVQDVASPEGFRRDPERVLRFYNERRRAARRAQPNAAHRRLADLEAYYDVVVVTQNVDDLHERAGSSRVIHLHGELLKARGVGDDETIYDLGEADIEPGDLCPKGFQLRPHVVWFGEMVPMMNVAARHAMLADHFLIVGTSLQVYPAAGLVDMVSSECFVYLVDPNEPYVHNTSHLYIFPERASVGMEQVYTILKAEAE
ncbi:MAG: Sir2 family NAD-dependent protein deacetylase [Catalinimonas sp.]